MQANPIVFFTVCTLGRRRDLATGKAHTLLRQLWSYSAEKNGWFVGDFLLMPDHVHFFARPSQDATPMRKWVGMWKSVSTRRLINHGRFWQKDYFDRYLRTGEDYAEKWRYVELNPVRAELVSHPDQWPHKGRIHNLRF